MKEKWSLRRRVHAFGHPVEAQIVAIIEGVAPLLLEGVAEGLVEAPRAEDGGKLDLGHSRRGGPGL